MEAGAGEAAGVSTAAEAFAAAPAEDTEAAMAEVSVAGTVAFEEVMVGVTGAAGVVGVTDAVGGLGSDGGRGLTCLMPITGTPTTHMTRTIHTTLTIHPTPVIPMDPTIAAFRGMVRPRIRRHPFKLKAIQ
jgi:hypothetical protein